jgi:hypothetical protein
MAPAKVKNIFPQICRNFAKKTLRRSNFPIIMKPEWKVYARGRCVFLHESGLPPEGRIAEIHPGRR